MTVLRALYHNVVRTQAVAPAAGVKSPRRMYSTGPAGKIGFIGLGQMGYGMAANLYRATASTHKWVIADSNPSTLTRFIDTVPSSTTPKATTPITSLANPSDIAAQSDVIVTMLPAGKHVRAVYEQLIKGLKPGTLCIDCSTIDVKTAKEVAGWVADKGGKMVDAPVSGGTTAANAGTLTFMVGSKTPADLDAAKQFLQHMGKTIHACGTIGTGQAAKICNNMMLGISMVGASEALKLGESLSLPPSLLLKILNTSSGRTWVSDTYPPVPNILPHVPSSNDYNGGFGSALMAKDLGLAMAAAEETGVNVNVGRAAEGVYREVASSEVGRGKDFSVVWRWLGGGEK
ncbi:NAD binding domain of 6-phosphogluconate dehydrogenase-domain-containing protein [Fimicolochytrium jonesii]|uniref:NAD binding domain of 6-phosphogluconate dehydrogenase-domain-containing protein n=1 Tax=Fimicolochytrium jonesii TaxID=1396493 RepID=UPI0022FE7DA8|nr:NAD binding domain of 6-phosphogluconate dehydrogenase-domain-containing protein [Fimicolochytrium jonesii]KAI8817257.1 NAD binding domain of 6-phosphogluconate dehydrogenase-domain-containing protein [Fimicolochytrium jonesii]